jgi:hypothetical protein
MPAMLLQALTYNIRPHAFIGSTLGNKNKGSQEQPRTRVLKNNQEQWSDKRFERGSVLNEGLIPPAGMERDLYLCDWNVIAHVVVRTGLTCLVLQLLDSRRLLYVSDQNDLQWSQVKRYSLARSSSHISTSK